MRRPYAITMWDFSWLERRWPGAGYEDWDQVLSELADRGYDAVRIDAYPHLVSADPDREWWLYPEWTQQCWGAQSPCVVRPYPALAEFIGKAREHGLAVSLSTWFRQDRDDTRLRIRTGADHARIWLDTLHLLERDGLLDSILFLDLCNEWPLRRWTPFLYDGDEEELARTSERSRSWQAESIGLVKQEYPDLRCTFSVCNQFESVADEDVSMLDLLEPHLWMPNATDYYSSVGYAFQAFDPTGYDNLAANGKRFYLENQERLDNQLFTGIDMLADWSRATGKPLVTTECWAIVDYKDWPLLDWDWVLDLNARAVEYVSTLGRWEGIATCNFAGPQFHGVWREIEWHRRLTDAIHRGRLDDDLR